MKHVYTIRTFHSLKFWKYCGAIADAEIKQWLETLGDGSFVKSFDEYMGDRIDENDQPLSTDTIKTLIMAMNSK